MLVGVHFGSASRLWNLWNLRESRQAPSDSTILQLSSAAHGNTHRIHTQLISTDLNCTFVMGLSWVYKFVTGFGVLRPLHDWKLLEARSLHKMDCSVARLGLVAEA